MNLTRNQIIIIGAAGLVIIFFILVFLGVIPGLKAPGTGGGGVGGGGSQSQITLNFWGVFDDSTTVQPIIDAYLKINPSVKINYQQFNDAAVYEKAILNALATGQAPDILMFHNGWLPKHYDKIAPAPETLFSLTQLRQSFPTVVEQDFVLSGKIYSLPLYVDTLALLYNKDIFDAKAIALTPKTWSEFQRLIPQLRQVNSLNQITKPAAAIGGSEKSIDSASDLLNLLMLQFGSSMANQYGQISFGSEGLAALNFYLQFSNPANPYYTWNESLGYSLDSFSQGSTAIIFNYASQIPLIKSKNPYLSIGIAPMLQTSDSSQSQPINYADYWGLAVSNQSKNPDWAWHFIVSVTTYPQISETYVQTAKKPPALRSLIEKYKNDPDLGVFSRQALTARSWKQPDSAAVKQIFSNMIELILSGRLSPQNALEQAKNEINGLK